MKLCRFQPLQLPAEGVTTRVEREVHPRPRTGIVEDDQLAELAADLPELLSLVSGGGACGRRNLPRTGAKWPLAQVQFLPPVHPSKIICVGRNYRDHAKELGNETPKEPLIFLKPPSAIVGPGEPIVLPPIPGRVDYEGELAVVIGRRCRNLGPGDDAFPYIAGYTCLNDVTARDLQKSDGQWTRGKGFDTFCPFGPVLATSIDLANAKLETFVNGISKQSGCTSEMIFPVDVIIRFVARVMTLEPADVIATGTPAGVGPLSRGDVVEVSIGGVGTLRNIVVGSEN